jgi:hypothetical protein
MVYLKKKEKRRGEERRGEGEKERERNKKAHPEIRRELYLYSTLGSVQLAVALYLHCQHCPPKLCHG